MRILTTAFSIGMAGILAGCAHTAVDSRVLAAPTPTEVAVTASDVRASDTPAAVDAQSRVGVAACDEYLDKVEACIVQILPKENGSDDILRGIDQIRDAWTAPGVDKAILAESCKNALVEAKTSFGTMGCTF